ncbi:MAG: hypothetical protein P8Y45_00580 [Exilibacterium sp.]
MKKLGFLFILAFVAQGVFANKVIGQYPNVALAVAETGANMSWVTNYENSEARKLEEEQLKQMTEQNKLDVNIQLQERISDMIKDSLESTEL